MTSDPQALADLHARCFVTPRPWTRVEFSQWLATPGIIFVGDERGFALGRAVVDEAELLTIVVSPEARRKGVARALLGQFERHAVEHAAATCFLEVAANNTAAISLYASLGYRESGLRKAYYSRPDAPPVDAILFSKSLNAH